MAIYQPFVFGSGILWGVALTDSSGTTITTPTPYRLGTLQEMNVEFSAPVDDLYGSYQYPLAIGRKTGKITAKCKFASYDAGALNNLFFGAPSSPTVNATSQVVIVSDEAGTVPASSTYTVTVTNSATWVTDLGVRYGQGASVGLPGTPMTRVASVSAVGTYSVAAGVYTFFSGDASQPVLIDYTYNPASGGYETIPINNYLLGAQPFVAVYAKMTYGSSQQKVGLYFFQCVADTLSIPTKLDGFSIGDFNFNAISNVGNGIGTMTTQYL